MWATIGSIALKYWVEFLFGIIVAIMSFLFKRYIDFLKKERAEEKDKLLQQVSAQIQEETDALMTSLTQQYNKLDEKMESEKDKIYSNIQDSIDSEHCETQEKRSELYSKIADLSNELLILKAGLLSIQGDKFRRHCHTLLEPEHKITIEEMEDLETEHHVYNSLGGNHRGDYLFEQVQQKINKHN